MDPRVLEAMLPYLQDDFGNASSIHQFGQKSRKAIDEARSKCIELLGAYGAHEIIFTGSGTESCNMAIMGAAFARKEKGNHIIISEIEHPAVREAAYYLRDNFDFELTEIAPNSEGLISTADIEAAIKKETILVSVIYANNEIGTVQPIKDIAALARERGVLFHTDACQAPGYENINVSELQPDLMTLNGSKIYGPKGIGLLYIREGLQITPHIHGGGQEFRMRGGTENTAAIVGFTKALELILTENHSEKIAKLRDKLLDELLKVPGLTLNGSRENRLANNINVHTPGLLGETLVMRLDIAGLAASSGSACASGKTDASHVLLALGQSPEQAQQSLRLTLGHSTTEKEITEAVRIFQGIFA